MAYVEERLDQSFGSFCAALGKFKGEARIDQEVFEILLRAAAVTAGAQVKALIWLDEKAVARKRAEKQVKMLTDVCWDFPTDLLARRMPDQRDRAILLGRAMGEMLAVFSSRPALVMALEAVGTHGRDYLEQAAAEQEEPILLLPAPGAI